MTSLIPGHEHQRALALGIDIPEQKPSFAIPLTSVGISGKTVWVNLPQGTLPFAATLAVSLPATVRGIHMSRMEEAVSELLDVQFSSPVDYVNELGSRMLRRQQGEEGTISLAGKLPLLRKTAISGRTSVDSVDIAVEGRFTKTNDGITKTILNGAGLFHITACPCTQAYNQVIFPDRICPQPTHSQRSLTRLLVETSQGRPDTGELLACLEGVLHVTQDLLKRPDEAEIVMKAHRAPQFAEDAVRETARAVKERFIGTLPDETRILIESLSLESIHIHDVTCRLETNLGALRVG